MSTRVLMENIDVKVICKKFTFCPKRLEEPGPVIEVNIPEALAVGYDQFVWRCAPVLAQYLYERRTELRHKHVLELGCGTALPGIVAAKLGAKVTLTDLPECLFRARQSCEVNDLVDEVSIVGITWGSFTPELFDLKPVDIILGSDCFYDTKDFEPIISTVSYIIDKSAARCPGSTTCSVQCSCGGSATSAMQCSCGSSTACAEQCSCEFWTTYQVRSDDRDISHLLHKWNLSCRRLSTSKFIKHEEKQQLTSDEDDDDDVQLLIITSDHIT